MYKIIALITCLACVLTKADLYGELKIPKIPDTPDVKLKGEQKRIQLPVIIDTAGKKKIAGFISPFSRHLQLKTGNRISMNIRKIELSSVKKVEILKWNGRKHRGTSYIFYPVNFRITLKDGNVIKYNKNLPELNRIPFTYRGTGKKLNVYTYFYDKWKDNRWENSGNIDFTYPRSHPHDDTAVTIIFDSDEIRSDSGAGIIRLLKK